MRFVLLIIMFLMINISTVSAQASEPEVFADSAILVDAITGEVLYEKNADVERYPASMTKMMTCILSIEYLPKDTPVTISENAVYAEDTYLPWNVGDVIRADELTLGMMLVSDNGGAVALAESISGSVPQFAEKMNEKAKEIGCTNTHFVNPNGLTDYYHYSTARDMAKIAMYGMNISDFRDIVSTYDAVIHWTSPEGKTFSDITTNKLIGNYSGATGIKTGWTSAAGGCLAASAMRGDVELIVIIMHAPDNQTRFDDAIRLLDYGFSIKGLNY